MNLRIKGSAGNRTIATAIISYTNHETPLGTEFAIIEKVQLEPSSYSTQIFELDLSDGDIYQQYKELLESKTGCSVHASLDEAIEDEKTWHEFYEKQEKVA